MAVVATVYQSCIPISLVATSPVSHVTIRMFSRVLHSYRIFHLCKCLSGYYKFTYLYHCMRTLWLSISGMIIMVCRLNNFYTHFENTPQLLPSIVTCVLSSISTTSNVGPYQDVHDLGGQDWEGKPTEKGQQGRQFKGYLRNACSHYALTLIHSSFTVQCSTTLNNWTKTLSSSCIWHVQGGLIHVVIATTTFYQPRKYWVLVS